MKVATLTPSITKCNIEQDVAKIGLIIKMDLGAVYTAALAKSKWDAFAAKMSLNLVGEGGQIPISYLVAVRTLAEITAAGSAVVYVKPHVTANFAEVGCIIDLTTMGAIRMGSKMINVEIVGLITTEEIHVLALNSPISATEVLEYQTLNVTANAAKVISLMDAITLSVPAVCDRLDLDFSNGQRVSLDNKGIDLIQATDNENTYNVEGSGAYILPLMRSIPVEACTSCTVYQSAAADVVIVRVA